MHAVRLFEPKSALGPIRRWGAGAGEFRVAVEASGYKTAQKDVSINMAVKSEVDITLQSETSTNFTPGPAGDPILAPKAKESLDKAIHALRDDNLDEAEKAIGQAMKLAGSNPDVLYGKIKGQ